MTVATTGQSGYFSTRLSYDASRERLWRVLCGYLQHRLPDDSAVLELGGGYCHFINNVRARQKHVVDIHEGIRDHAAIGVQCHVHSCVALPEFGDGVFDVVFASNLFEHLTSEEFERTLQEVCRVLKDGGKLLVIQPNFRYSYREYFDDYTHKLVFTHVSLCDVLLGHGFSILKVMPRFLPFSIKSQSPKPSWLLWLYLRLPVRPFAGQMYVEARLRK